LLRESQSSCAQPFSNPTRPTVEHSSRASSS
jgi:hypothetical protein